MKWNKLMIRDRPMGAVLNKDTADSFDLVDSGTIVSDCGRFMIQSEGENGWSLFPNTLEANSKYLCQSPNVFDTFTNNKDLDYLKKIAETL